MQAVIFPQVLFCVARSRLSGSKHVSRFSFTALFWSSRELCYQKKHRGAVKAPLLQERSTLGPFPLGMSLTPTHTACLFLPEHSFFHRVFQASKMAMTCDFRTLFVAPQKVRTLWSQEKSDESLGCQSRTSSRICRSESQRSCPQSVSPCRYGAISRNH